MNKIQTKIQKIPQTKRDATQQIVFFSPSAGDAHPKAAGQDGPTQRTLSQLPEPPHGPLGTA